MLLWVYILINKVELMEKISPRVDIAFKKIFGVEEVSKMMSLAVEIIKFLKKGKELE